MSIHFCNLDAVVVIDEDDYKKPLSLDEIRWEAALKLQEYLERWLAHPNNPNYELDLNIETE